MWQWVQAFGQQAVTHVHEQITDWQTGKQPEPEALTDEITALPLLIGADGVTLPFRPHPGNAKGKIVYREVKVALLARLAQRVTRSGKLATQLLPRRLVAVLGNTNLNSIQGR